jgi:transcriptional regulator with XRE-family HTH domain
MKMRGIEPGGPQNWRQTLGETIKLLREERGRSHRQVSRRTRASISDVQAWERGALVPTGEQWTALKQGINRGLGSYQDLYRNARNEELRERETITKGISVHNPNTNGRQSQPGPPLTTKPLAQLASITIPPAGPTLKAPAVAPDARTVNPGQPVGYVEKPAAVQLPPTIAIPERVEVSDGRRAKDGRRLPPPKPSGSNAADQVEIRKRYVRALLAQWPNKRTTGADSVLEAVRKQFGVGISPEAVDAIRAEMRGTAAPVTPEPRDATIFTAPELFKVPSAAQEQPLAQPVPEAATVEINEADITAAVDLVLGAIPNLQEFSIRVDESGEAHVDYQIREVKITTRGGSLKVKR